MPFGSSGSANAPGTEIAYAQITATVNITGTTEGTATAIISPAAITFDGTLCYVEFFTISLIPPGAAPGDESHVGLFESGTLICSLALCQNNVTNAASFNTTFGKQRITPSAGAHTYVVGGWANSTTNTPRVLAGAGGAGNNPPAWVRFVKA